MSKKILAVITTRKEKIAGGAPIFFADSREQLQQTAVTLEKILDAMAHELDAETLIVVRHR
jgi:hypothetical protein